MGLNELLGFKGPTHLKLTQTHSFDTPTQDQATNKICLEACLAKEVWAAVMRGGTGHRWIRLDSDHSPASHISSKVVFFFLGL